MDSLAKRLAKSTSGVSTVKLWVSENDSTSLVACPRSSRRYLVLVPIVPSSMLSAGMPLSFRNSMVVLNCSCSLS